MSISRVVVCGAAALAVGLGVTAAGPTHRIRTQPTEPAPVVEPVCTFAEPPLAVPVRTPDVVPASFTEPVPALLPASVRPRF